MKFNEEMMQFGREVVSQCRYSFLSRKDIIRNFKDYGFLVNECVGLGYTSYLEYDRNKQRGILSFSKEKEEKEQEKILLVNFCAFFLEENNQFQFYYPNIPSKRKLKLLSSCLKEASAEKEFMPENEEMNTVEREGKVRGK